MKSMAKGRNGEDEMTNGTRPTVAITDSVISGSTLNFYACKHGQGKARAYEESAITGDEIVQLNEFRGIHHLLRDPAGYPRLDFPRWYFRNIAMTFDFSNNTNLYLERHFGKDEHSSYRFNLTRSILCEDKGKGCKLEHYSAKTSIEVGFPRPEYDLPHRSFNASHHRPYKPITKENAACHLDATIAFLGDLVNYGCRFRGSLPKECEDMVAELGYVQEVVSNGILHDVSLKKSPEPSKSISGAQVSSPKEVLKVLYPLVYLDGRANVSKLAREHNWAPESISNAIDHLTDPESGLKCNIRRELKNSQTHLVREDS